MQDWRNLILFDSGSTLNEHFLCKICNELVQEPQECLKCQNLYCKNCVHVIRNFFNNNMQRVDKCPISCGLLQIKSASQYLITPLENLKFRCRNQQQGCQQLFTYSTIKNHLQQCRFDQAFQSSLHIGQYNNDTIAQLENQYQYNYQILNIENKHLKFQVQALKNKNTVLKEELTDSQDKDRIEEIHKQPFINSLIYNCPQNLTHEVAWAIPKSGTCAECRNYNVLRYICKQCNISFCSNCKLPEIVNFMCPMGHTLKLKTKTAWDIKCDCCNQIVNTNQSAFYQDQICDLDICEQCFQTKILRVQSYQPQ